MASLVQRPASRVYYIQFYVSSKLRRVSTGTTSLQLAKEKLRQFESAQARGEDSPLPTRTPIPAVIDAFVAHIRTRKTAKSAQTDTYYLREAFGPVCEALRVTSRNLSPKARRRPLLPGAEQDLRRRPLVIEAASFEQITTTQITAFIDGQVRSRGLAPKTANRYREILSSLFNWATKQHGLRLNNTANPAAAVPRHREHAPTIRFLTLRQIDEQLDVLASNPQLRAMVATLIFAGLRREELLWLTRDDVDLNTGPHGILRIRAKTINEQFWQPKTKRNRAIPISSSLRPFLEQQLGRRDGHPWLFPSPKGSRWDCDNFSADLRTANAKARLPWTNLDYRHTFGSQLAMKGESLYKIATLLGNSPEICRKHYAALVPESLTDSVEFAAPATPVSGPLPSASPTEPPPASSPDSPLLLNRPWTSPRADRAEGTHRPRHGNRRAPRPHPNPMRRTSNVRAF